jgi:predicted acylesterase/phospholipase RssA
LADKRLRIQVAFQGGGAKIFALIAAAEILKRFEREGKIEVTRIAGTSAGALVGTLYAAGVGPDLMRAEFGSFPIQELMTRSLLPARLAMLRKAVKNRPIAKVAPLERLLVKLLRSALGTKDLVFGSLAIPAVVVATDVGRRLPQRYKEGPLIPAMLSSCAIPFFFRTASPQNTDSLILDGGLWANLPSDELEQSAALGPIVAFTFLSSEEAEIPKNSYQLAKALLDTAIESSVAHARSRAGLHVIELNPYGISTFDFEQAQRELVVPAGRPYRVGPAYDRACKATQDRLEDLIEESRREPQVVLSNIWKAADLRMMERLHRVYKSQEIGRTFKYLRHLVIIQADSLRKGGGEEAQDVLTQILTFKPSTAEIDFILLSLSGTGREEIGFVSCSVTDALGRKVAFEYFPVMDTQGPGLLVAFTPPLKKGDGDFRVRVRYKVRDSMPYLKKGERDEIELTNERADGVVDRMEFVLLVPEGFGRVRVEAPPETEPGVHPGKLWNLDDVARGMTPEGFIPYGWAGEQVPAGAVFKAYFLADPQL